MLEDQASKYIFPNGNSKIIDNNPRFNLYSTEGLDDFNKIEDQILLDSEYCKKTVNDNILYCCS